MTHRFAARESVGYQATWTIGYFGGDAIDISGWTFAAVLQRQKGAPDLTLGMASSLGPLVEGFFVFNGPKGQLAVNILPGALSGIADTTGHFKLFGDLLGTPPGMSPMFVKALELRVTTIGPW